MDRVKERVGRVVNVSGSQIVVLIELPPDGDNRDQAAPLQMGELVKMFTPAGSVSATRSTLAVPSTRIGASSSDSVVIGSSAKALPPNR